jgi:protease-4
MDLIRTLFKYFWKTLTWLRIIIINLVFLLVLVLFIGSFSSAPQLIIPENSALVLAPSGVLVEKSTYQPGLGDLLAGQDRPPETVLHELTYALRTARDDENISGVILRLDYLQQAGMSKIEELGQAINYFKESGKPVLAYSDTMSQQQYLLASYADEIYLHDMGGLYLTGFGAYQNYFKSALDKLSLKFHVFRVGNYKDAVEPFLRDDMSDASKEHIGVWINELWQRYASIIETHRSLEQGSVANYVTNLKTDLHSLDGDAAQLAINAGLIDDALTRIEIKNLLIARFGANEDGQVNALGVSNYLKNPLLPELKESNNKIGLIVANGNIIDGEQTDGTIGGDSLSRLIDDAGKDDSLKALVLRVDSGGGSAFASEVIRNRLKQVHENGLPVYLSMGSVAASGGYWIATPADEIWATPATVTGSIGVFGLIPNISDSMARLGVHTDGVGTTDLAGALRIDRPMSEDAKSIVQSGVDNIYQRFLDIVAESRDSTPESIHELAQGRIWSGTKAKELGLVDELGSLEDLYSNIASDLDLPDYTVKQIKRKLSFQEKFFQTLMDQASLATFNQFIKQNRLLNVFFNNDAINDQADFLSDSPTGFSHSVYAFCELCDEI